MQRKPIDQLYKSLILTFSQRGRKCSKQALANWQFLFGDLSDPYGRYLANLLLVYCTIILKFTNVSLIVIFLIQPVLTKNFVHMPLTIIFLPPPPPRWAIVSPAGFLLDPHAVHACTFMTSILPLTYGLNFKIKSLTWICFRASLF